MRKIFSVFLCVVVLVTSVVVPVSANTDYAEKIQRAVNDLRWWINNVSDIEEGENFTSSTVMDYTFSKFDPNEYGEDYIDFGDGYGYYERVVIPRETFEGAAQNYFATFSIESLRSETKSKYDYNTDTWSEEQVYNSERDAYVFNYPGGFGDSGRYFIEFCEKEDDKYIVYSNFLDNISEEYIPEDFVLGEDYFLIDGEYYEYDYTIKNVVRIINGEVQFASWQTCPRPTNAGGHIYDSHTDAVCNDCGEVRYISYEIEEDEAVITGWRDGLMGALEIPSEIEGFPVTKIGEYAFMECTSLAKITIPDSVKVIDDGAFWLCENLASIELGTGLTHIGSNAFYSCDRIEKIEFPNSLETIDSFAFQQCIKLKSVTIPSSVTKIGEGAFLDCHVLSEILVDEDNAAYTSVDGILFDKDIKTLIQFPRGLGSTVSEYTVPSTVTDIGAYAFYRCNALTKITFTNNVAEIGNDAFYETALTDVFFMGNEADRENIYISEHDNDLLLNATWHYNPNPEDANHEYTNNFDTKCNICGKERSRNPKTIVENGVTYYIEPTENGGLASVTDCEVEVSGTVTILSSVNNCPVVAVRDNAFYRCEEIISIIIPESVKSIGKNAFTYCGKLQTINIPNGITKIEQETFMGCFALKKINIPNGVTEIGDEAFYNSGLEEIALPSGLQTIGDSAFSFTCIKEITVPETVTYIGYYALVGCESLEKMTIPFVGVTPSVSQENMSHMLINLFDNHYGPPESLKEVVVTAPCKVLGNAAFYDCANIEKITLPDTITSIEGNTFTGCSSLVDLTIGNIESLPIDCGLYNLASLKNIYVGSDNPSYVFENGILFSKDKTEIILSPRGNGLTTYTVPSTVTSIGERAFFRNEKLENVTLHKGVTSIGDFAFNKCIALYSINLPETLSYIGQSAFYECKNLVEVVLPKGITAISSGAFYGCEKLTSVSIPNSVTEIGESAFCYCISLESVQFGSKVKEIGQTAFLYCIALKNVVIPSGVETIGLGAFGYCIKLESIKIPSSVTTIGEMAFYETSALADVYYTGSEAQKGEIAIGGENGYLLNATWHYNIEPDAHEHSFDNSDYDDKHHWSYCDCGELGEKFVHSFDNSCDTTCNNCDAVREASHNFEWLTDKKATCGKSGTKHQECTVCGETKNENTVIAATGNHDYKAATCTKARTCKVCGKTSGSSLGHKSDNGTITKKATCTATGTKTYKCTVCKSTVKTTTLAKLGHTYSNDCDKSCNRCSTNRTVKAHRYSNTCDKTCNECGAVRTIKHSYKTTTTKATLTKNGKIVKKCSVCGSVASTTIVKYAKTFKLSATTYTYSGGVKTPSVTVKDSAGKTLKKNTDYTVTYASGRKNVGTYKVTVKMKGNYSGTKTLTFKINPPKTTVSKVTAGKKKLTVKLTKKTSQVTGYELQYSTSKTFKSAKTKKITSYKTTSTSLTGLSAKKTYYVRVRTYKKVGSTYYYSGWSTYKTGKTK